MRAPALGGAGARDAALGLRAGLPVADPGVLAGDEDHPHQELLVLLRLALEAAAVVDAAGLDVVVGDRTEDAAEDLEGRAVGIAVVLEPADVAEGHEVALLHAQVDRVVGGHAVRVTADRNVERAGREAHFDLAVADWVEHLEVEGRDGLLAVLLYRRALELHRRDLALGGSAHASLVGKRLRPERAVDRMGLPQIRGRLAVAAELDLTSHGGPCYRECRRRREGEDAGGQRRSWISLIFTPPELTTRR